jgi:hypothetical protein
MMALVVHKNGRPNMMGALWSCPVYNTKKSATTLESSFKRQTSSTIPSTLELINLQTWRAYLCSAKVRIAAHYHRPHGDDIHACAEITNTIKSMWLDHNRDDGMTRIALLDWPRVVTPPTDGSLFVESWFYYLDSIDFINHCWLTSGCDMTIA